MKTLYDDLLARCGGCLGLLTALVYRSVRTSSGVEGIEVPVTDLERRYCLSNQEEEHYLEGFDGESQ